MSAASFWVHAYMALVNASMSYGSHCSAFSS